MSGRTIFGKQWKPYPPPVASPNMGREKVKSVVINSDKSIGYLEEYKGHVLVNLRELDAGTAVKPEKEAYVLEFSDDKAEDYFEQELLTIEEQQLVLKAARQRAMSGNLLGYDELHRFLCQNRFDGGEDE